MKTFCKEIKENSGNLEKATRLSSKIVGNKEMDQLYTTSQVSNIKNKISQIS